MSAPTVIVGAGGHAHVVADALLSAGVAVNGFTDADAALLGRQWHGLPVLGADSFLLNCDAADYLLANGIGSVRDTSRRRAVYEQFVAAGFSFRSVIHPTAIISPRCDMADSVQIMAGALVQTDARVGANTLVNSGARIDHDCEIGAHVHLAPGVVLSGGVRIGDGSHLGTGAIVIQGVSIGAGCVVAAGAVVINDLPDGAFAAGVPATPRKQS